MCVCVCVCVCNSLFGFGFFSFAFSCRPNADPLNLHHAAVSVESGIGRGARPVTADSDVEQKVPINEDEIRICS